MDVDVETAQYALAQFATMIKNLILNHQLITLQTETRMHPRSLVDPAEHPNQEETTVEPNKESHLPNKVLIKSHNNNNRMQTATVLQILALHK